MPKYRAARAAVMAAAVVTGVLSAGLFAAPASAHVEVTADNPRAGATNVTVTFTGEAESSSAGLRSQRVVLPKGIAPGDVRLAKAPPGWRFTVGPDGYTVAGKALPIGRNATHSIIVAQLPSTAKQLVFKTVETYGDGKVDRWIEVPEPGQGEPENPAPVLTLRPAARPTAPRPAAPSATAGVVSPGAADPSAAVTSSAVGSAAPASPGSPAADDPVNAAAPAADRTGWWIALAALIGAAAVGGLLLARRRRQPPTTP